MVGWFVFKLLRSSLLSPRLWAGTMQHTGKGLFILLLSAGRRTGRRMWSHGELSWKKKIQGFRQKQGRKPRIGRFQPCVRSSRLQPHLELTVPGLEERRFGLAQPAHGRDANVQRPRSDLHRPSRTGRWRTTAASATVGKRTKTCKVEKQEIRSS